MNDLSVAQRRDEGWYLSLMAPNKKGLNFAWLDPSRLYCNAQALSDCVTDLLKPFQSDLIDLVAGIDAMGFILGSAVATTLGKGFLAIRKAGHLCVETQTQEYTDYSGRGKLMEVRVDVLKPGLHVFIVDQWIETGGTMKAAIKLIENQGATVVGVAAIAIQNSEGGKWIKENYKHSHCIPMNLQSQIDNQYLESFKNFNRLVTEFSSTCSLLSLQITMSSANIIVYGDYCLTSSINQSITTANKKGLKADP